MHGVAIWSLSRPLDVNLKSNQSSEQVISKASLKKKEKPWWENSYYICINGLGFLKGLMHLQMIPFISEDMKD